MITLNPKVKNIVWKIFVGIQMLLGLVCILMVSAIFGAAFGIHFKVT